MKDEDTRSLDEIIKAAKKEIDEIEKMDCEKKEKIALENKSNYELAATELSVFLNKILTKDLNQTLLLFKQNERRIYNKKYSITEEMEKKYIDRFTVYNETIGTLVTKDCKDTHMINLGASPFCQYPYLFITHGDGRIRSLDGTYTIDGLMKQDKYGKPHHIISPKTMLPLVQYIAMGYDYDDVDGCWTTIEKKYNGNLLSAEIMEKMIKEIIIYSAKAANCDLKKGL